VYGVSMGPLSLACMPVTPFKGDEANLSRLQAKILWLSRSWAADSSSNRFSFSRVVL